MISVQEKDIGRKVIYEGQHGFEPEEGVITSFNDNYIFVRYGADYTAKATRPEDLRFI